MKLNNKGLTIVEIVCVFVILMVIVMGMLRIISSIKQDLMFKQEQKDFVEYDSILFKTISDDLIKEKFAKISNYTVTEEQISCNLNFSNPPQTKELKIYLGTYNDDDKRIVYDGVVYNIPHQNITVFPNGYFEEGQSLEYVSITTKNNILTINIPYYEVNVKGLAKEQHGIKIVHPY